MCEYTEGNIRGKYVIMKQRLLLCTQWRNMWGEGKKVQLHAISISALDEGEWPPSAQVATLPRCKRTSGTHCTRWRVRARAGLDALKKRMLSCSSWEQKNHSSIVKVTSNSARIFTCSSPCSCNQNWYRIYQGHKGIRYAGTGQAAQTTDKIPEIACMKLPKNIPQIASSEQHEI